MSPTDSSPHAPNDPASAASEPASLLRTGNPSERSLAHSAAASPAPPAAAGLAVSASRASSRPNATGDEPAPSARSSGPVLSSRALSSWVAPLPAQRDEEDATWRPAPRVPQRRRASDGQLLLRAIWTSAKIAAVLFVAYGLMFNFSVVRGSSMTPGIHDGDRILVDHVSYLFGDVQRGDVVVLQYPLDPTLDYIKRVIGLPGDRIEIDGGRVCVNGTALDEPYIADPDPRTHLAVIVEPEHFFVLGDNRPHSSDSREFGQVPRQNLRGKVDVRVWPPERIGSVE